MMYHVKVFFVFVLGFAIGVLLAVMLFLSSNVPIRPNNNLNTPRKNGVDFFLEDPNTVSLEDNILRLRTVGKMFRESNINRNEEQNRTEFYDEFKATKKQSLKSINLVCVIFSSDLSNSFAAAGTWAKHCSSFHFYGKSSNVDLYKYLNVTYVAAKHSWHFLCEVLRHVYNIHRDSFHWLLFIPDDSFAIPENLRHYVRYKDYRKPYYLGDISCFWFTYYNTAEAGYVLSRGAVLLLMSLFNSSEACLAGGKHWRNEDYHLGRHLYNLGVRPEDTRDALGRGRFHTFTPEQLYLPDEGGILDKYFRRRIHPYKQGPNCCNKRSITFRASCQDRIFFYYYMLYRIKTYVTPDIYPNNLSDFRVETPQVWQKFIFDELGKDTDLNSIDADEYYRLWAKKVTPEDLVTHIRDESNLRKKNEGYMSGQRKKYWR